MYKLFVVNKVAMRPQCDVLNSLRMRDFTECMFMVEKKWNGLIYSTALTLTTCLYLLAIKIHNNYRAWVV